MTAMEETVETVDTVADLPREIVILGGLEPFPHERYRVSEEPDAPPFLRIQTVDDDLVFHVLDPFLVLDNYEPAIGDEDDRLLGLTGVADTRLLVIVNLSKGASQATVNLAAPIVVNRKTGRAKQVILQNATQYSVRHKLFG